MKVVGDSGLGGARTDLGGAHLATTVKEEEHRGLGSKIKDALGLGHKQ